MIFTKDEVIKIAKDMGITIGTKASRYTFIYSFQKSNGVKFIDDILSVESEEKLKNMLNYSKLWKSKINLAYLKNRKPKTTEKYFNPLETTPIVKDTKLEFFNSLEPITRLALSAAAKKNGKTVYDIIAKMLNERILSQFESIAEDLI